MEPSHDNGSLLNLTETCPLLNSSTAVDSTIDES